MNYAGRKRITPKFLHTKALRHDDIGAVCGLSAFRLVHFMKEKKVRWGRVVYKPRLSHFYILRVLVALCDAILK
jgi:hypothetical protein